MRAVLVVRNHWVFKSRMNIICSNIITSTSCTVYPPCFILIPEVMDQGGKLNDMRRRSSSAFQSFLRRTSGFTGSLSLLTLRRNLTWQVADPSPLLPSDSLFHILWISQLVSEFTWTWNICDIKHKWLSNRSVINDRTEEVITEDLFWTDQYS